jgi:hypothetical protein
MVLPENKNMLALDKRLGFEIRKSAEAGDNELVSSVNANEPLSRMRAFRSSMKGRYSTELASLKEHRHTSVKEETGV